MRNLIKSFILALTLTLAAPLAAQDFDVRVAAVQVPGGAETTGALRLANRGETQEWSGAHSPRAAFSVVVARNDTEWRQLWTDLSQPSPVALDTANQMAIAVFLGLRRTGGFAVEIAAVEDGPVFYRIDVSEKKPAPDAMVPQVLTTPYVIRIVPRSDRPVMFRQVDAAAAHIHIPNAEVEIAETWISDLWTALEEARGENQQLKYIVEQSQRQIEQLHRELRERCDPNGIGPT